MKQWRIDVTFEYQHRPPQTTRLRVQAGSIATAAFRAVRLAKKALKPRGVISMVVLSQEVDIPTVGPAEGQLAL